MRFSSLLQLKRLGVSTEKLTLFYLENNWSILTYCIAVFFSLLSQRNIDILERTQRMCTRIILPHIDSYTARLTVLGLPTVENFSLSLFRSHFFKIYNNKQHRLSTLVPDRQSNGRRHSARTKDGFLTGCRTMMKSNSFFYHAVDHFF